MSQRGAAICEGPVLPVPVQLIGKVWGVAATLLLTALVWGLLERGWEEQSKAPARAKLIITVIFIFIIVKIDIFRFCLKKKKTVRLIKSLTLRCCA